MTPSDLSALLRALDPELPVPLDAETALAHLEALPSHPETAAAVLALTRWSTAAESSFPGGLVRETLVEWDAFSATWTARDARGEHFLVRGLRPGVGAPLRRLLQRDGIALRGLVDGVEIGDGVLVAPAPGIPFDEATLPVGRRLEVLVQALDIAERYAAAGIGPGWADETIRLTDRGLRVCALTPGRVETGTAGLLARIAARLPVRGDGPLARFARGLREWDLEIEAVRQGLSGALAAELAERAVDLRRRRLATAFGSRKLRLEAAVGALMTAVPPPRGRAAVGFDLDGNPTTVDSDGRRVRFGGTPPDVLYADGTFEAPAARRFLRAVAAAPARDEGVFVENLGRWIATGLRARTLRMLLERG